MEYVQTLQPVELVVVGITFTLLLTLVSGLVTAVAYQRPLVASVALRGVVMEYVQTREVVIPAPAIGTMPIRQLMPAWDQEAVVVYQKLLVVGQLVNPRCVGTTILGSKLLSAV